MYKLAVGVCGLAMMCGTSWAQTEMQYLMSKDPLRPEQYRLIWATEPGLRYQLLNSTNLLSDWAQTPGFPLEAQTMSMAYTLPNQGRGFFSATSLDEQAPVITSQYPAPDAFAIPRFADLSVTLLDATGIDPASIELSINGDAAQTLGSPGMLFSNNVLTLSTTNDALGGWGETVTVSLVAADLLGYAATNHWNFRLETEAIVSSNLFVFGSPVAKRSGQSVSGPAAPLAALYNDPSPAKRIGASSSDWVLQNVTSNQVIIAYTNGTPPVFTAGQLICNLTPANIDEIFYRRVLGSSTNGGGVLTLYTEDALLTEFASQGTVSLSESSVVFETGAGGTLKTALYAVGGTLDFRPASIDLSGGSISLRSDGFTVNVPGLTAEVGDGLDWITVDLDEYRFTFDPVFEASLEVGYTGFKAFHAQATGAMDASCVLSGSALLAGIKSDLTLGRVSTPPVIVYVGQLGFSPVPVYATLSLTAELKTTAEASGTLDFDMLYRQDHELTLGLDWRDGQGIDWIHHYLSRSLETGGDADLNTAFSLEVSLEPRLEFLFYGAAGFGVGFDLTGSVTVDSAGDSGTLGANFDLVAERAGWLLELLDVEESLSLELWSDTWPISPAAQTPFAIVTHPADRTVNAGESTSFTCTVKGAATPKYQWFHQGREVPGQTGREMVLQRVMPEHSGTVKVQVSSGGERLISNPASLSVRTGDIELADRFQYPIGDRTPIPEFPLNPEIPEINDFYPDNNTGNILLRGSAGGQTGLWANKQDVGAMNTNYGGLHPGEDWNYGGTTDDIGQPVYPIANGKVVKIVPASANVQELGWVVVVEHQLDGSIRRPEIDASRYYSIYVHVTSEPNGTVPSTATGFPFQVGQSVSLDTALGYIAALTSPDADPHLHLELRKYVRDLKTEPLLWPTSRGGYYSNAAKERLSLPVSPGQVQTAFNLMQDEGIVDPSDFIDAHQAVLPPVPPAPSGMVLIPAGSFSMGDASGGTDGYDDELPVHSVNVNAFYMDKYEVTNDEIVDVFQWAYGQGKLTVSSSTVRNAQGSSQELLDLDDSDCRIIWNGSKFVMKATKGAGYPCVEITWHGSVAYCNYRSEKEGRTPCYNLSDWSCNWSANGYRLPTEAEWEYAARGGLSGQRFPWGETIQHSRANYGSSSSYSYDTSPTRGYHPDYDDGGYPYTSPVGTFSPNAYGLYDMSGNVWEWCWDWYNSSYYGSSPGSDPRGPASGSYRVHRGGGWSGGAGSCRVANRINFYPINSNSSIGFRAVLPPGQQ